MKFFLPVLFLFGLSSCAHDNGELKTASSAEKNKTVASAYYTAYNARSIDGQTSLMTDGFIYISNSGEVREGKEAYRKYTESLFAEVHEKVVEIKYFFDPQQSVVIAHGIAEGTYETTAAGMPKARGQKYRIPVVEFFEMKDGQIARLTTVYNENLWSEQIKAASEPAKKK